MTGHTRLDHLKALVGALFLSLAVTAAAGARPTTPVLKTGSAKLDSMIARANDAMLTDPAAAVEQARAAQAFAMRQPSLRERARTIAKTEWLQGEGNLRLNNVDIAAPLIERAYRTIAQDPRPLKIKGDILLSRGGIHSARVDVAAALADYHQAYKMFHAVGEARSQAIALLSIASLYRDAADYKSALKYYQQALSVYHGDPKFELAIFNNRGNMLNDMGRHAEGDAQLHRALALAKSMPDSKALQANILANLAGYDAQVGELAKAEEAIREGRLLAAQLGDSATQAVFDCAAARIALVRNNLDHARQLIERGLAGSDLEHPTPSLRFGYVVAYKIYKRLGDDARALDYLEAVKALDDETAKLAASTNTALMAARFDYTNQNLKIAQLEAKDLQRRIAYERSQAHFERIIFIGGAVAALIVVALLTFGLITIRRSRNQVRAANVDLAATNAALAKALAAKTEFLATTSHEIRTPLNGILGMTQVMLADKSLSGAVRDRLDVVHGAGMTMRALVDDILDVAKMETGNLAIEHAPMNTCALLGDVARMWQDQARARGIDFVLDLDDCPACIEGDAARLRQIVFNLLANALKFTQAGTITLTAGVDRSTREDPRVRIAVRDTGIGIPHDKQGEIFESFRQADTSTTRQFGGTGLGLTICRNLARAMGGDISVDSVVGKGSVFTLDFPLLESEQAEPAGDAAAPESGLLIVDRNPISRSMLAAVLEARAGQVAFAGSLAEATAIVERGGIERVLIDDATARRDEDHLSALGALARVTRASGARSALLWPANAATEDEERLTATGIDRVVGKPIAGPALLAILYPINETKRDEPGVVSRAA